MTLKKDYEDLEKAKMLLKEDIVSLTNDYINLLDKAKKSGIEISSRLFLLAAFLEKAKIVYVAELTEEN